MNSFVYSSDGVSSTLWLYFIFMIMGWGWHKTH